MKAPFEASVTHARIFFSVTTTEGTTFYVPFSCVQFVSLSHEHTQLFIRTAALSITIHGSELQDAARWISDHHLVSASVGSSGITKAPSATEIQVVES